MRLIFSAQIQRAQGKPGAAAAPIALRAKMEKHASKVTTGTPKTSGLPCALGYGLLRDLLGEPGFFATVASAIAEAIVARLISASGYRDHTTSPSAAMSLVASTLPRPSHPAPNVRDDRDTPLLAGPGRAGF
jgi:hypothetical protein